MFFFWRFAHHPNLFYRPLPSNAKLFIEHLFSKIEKGGRASRESEGNRGERRTEDNKEKKEGKRDKSNFFSQNVSRGTGLGEN